MPPSGSSASRGSDALEPLDAVPDLRGVPAELLAQGDRGGVHQVGAAGLHHGRELGGLAPPARRPGGPAPGSGRGRRASVAATWIEDGKTSLRRLRGVDVVVRDGPCGPSAARGQRREHLVGVHVRAGAGAGLEHVDRELGVVLAGGDRVGGRRDRLGDLGLRARPARR